MKLLILHPDLKKLGGIEGYYLKLCKRFSIPFAHFPIGKRVGESGRLNKIFRLLGDYLRFYKVLKWEQIDIVQINPSFEAKSFFREGLFVLIAKLNKVKVVTFFRGWDVDFQEKIDRYGVWLFRILYGKSDSFIVLSDRFAEVIRSWGDYRSIQKEFTLIDDDSLAGFDISQTLAARQRSEHWRILFLSRIFKEKGVYETIEAYQILKEKYPQLELVIAGDGVELKKVKKLVAEKKLADVVFTGDIRGEEKDHLFHESHVFCFPTYHNEGLPNAIIEAMAFGLPIVTRPVGGVGEFFQHGRHGFLSESRQPTAIAEHLEKLLVNSQLYEEISLQNAAYAKGHFSSAQAALRFEKLYTELLNESAVIPKTSVGGGQSAN